jgi:hypothetical protein
MLARLGKTGILVVLIICGRLGDNVYVLLCESFLATYHICFSDYIKN